VVKLLTALSDADRQDLYNEAHVLWAFNHPLVRLPVLLTHTDGVPALVLEFVPGVPLNRAEASKDLAEQVLRQIGLTLRSVHAAGIVHGDIKPENLIVGPDGDIRLIDFGLARRFKRPYADALDVTQNLGGTWAYMAPEVVQGGPLSQASDWYSLGAVLHHLLTGEPPILGNRLSAASGPVEAVACMLLDPSPTNRLGEGLDPFVLPIPTTLPLRPEREREGEVLAEWLDIAVSGVCVVSGPAGSGKSALVRRTLGTRSALSTRCYPFETRPFAGMRWLAPLLEVDQDISDWMQERLHQTDDREALAIEVRDKLDLKNDVVHVVIEDAERLDADSVFVLRMLLARLLRTTLRLVLCVRDEQADAVKPLTNVGEVHHSVFHMRLLAVEDPSPQPSSMSDPEHALLGLLALHGSHLERSTADAAMNAIGFAKPISLQRLVLLSQLEEEGSRLRTIQHAAGEEWVRDSDSETLIAAHRALAEAIAASSSETTSPIVHLAAMGELDRATAMASALADTLMEQGAFGLAAEWLRRAITWQPDSPERSALQWRLAKALFAEGHAREAAVLFAHFPNDEGVTHHAQALFDAGEFDQGWNALQPALRANGLAWTTSSVRLGMSALRDLVWLLWAGVPNEDRAETVRTDAAALCWMAARGAMMTKPGLTMALALRAVRLGAHTGSVSTAGRALAFVGGGVFLQTPLFHSRSRQWLAHVRHWSVSDEALAPTADLWEGVSAVSQGRWTEARTLLRGARKQLDGNPDGQFELIAAAVAEMVSMAHEGDYARLLDVGTREWDRARRRGDDLYELVFSMLSIDAFLAGSQTAPVRSILERAERLLPDKFTPQRYDWLDGSVHLLLSLGDVDEALSLFQRYQKPFRRAGGNFAEVTRFRNAKLGVRVGLASGHPEVLRTAGRTLLRMKRPDTTAYLNWMQAVTQGVARTTAQELADGFERTNAHGMALGLRLAVGDPEASEQLITRGVADPVAWSKVMAPLEMP
jgi:serine/threonine protein kinase